MGDGGEKVKVYYSSVSSSMGLKKKQERIMDVLGMKHIDYEQIDIAVDTDQRTKMRELCGDPKALPPQIFLGDNHCGDYDEFDLAVEDGLLTEFLKGKTPPPESEPAPDYDKEPECDQNDAPESEQVENGVQNESESVENGQEENKVPQETKESEEQKTEDS